jgi:hypothetical protein
VIASMNRRHPKSWEKENQVQSMQLAALQRIRNLMAMGLLLAFFVFLLEPLAWPHQHEMSGKVDPSLQ